MAEAPEGAPTLFAIEPTIPKIVSPTAVPAARAKMQSVPIEEPAPSRNTTQTRDEPEKKRSQRADGAAYVDMWGRVKGWDSMHYVVSLEGNRLRLACDTLVRAFLWTAKARPGMVRCNECSAACKAM